MITAAPGATFEAICDSVVTGKTGTLTVRIVDNAGGTSYGPTTSGISEIVTANGYGVYAVTLTAPTTAGQYTVVWNDGTNPPFAEDLVVSSSSLGPLVPNGDDLTDVATAAAYIGDTSANTTRLQLLITAYSRAARRYTNRQFMPEQNGVAKRFRYDGNGVLNFGNTELRGDPTSVVMYTDLPSAQQVTLQDGDTVSESDFRLEPRNGTLEGTYLWMVLPRRTVFPVVSSATPSPADMKHAEVTITGDWGSGVVPADVALAVLIAVENGYRNPGQYQATSIGGIQISEPVDTYAGPGRSLPPDSRALLGPYRRVTLA